MQMQHAPTVYPAPPQRPTEQKGSASSPRPPERRSSSPAPRRSSRKRRRRGSALAAWQWVTLIVLFACLVVSLIYWGQGQSRLTVLRAQREQERLAYEKQVQDHQVRYRELIEQYAAEYDLNPAFVSAIIMTESAYNPRAYNSGTSATGLMQFLPRTFEWVRNNCGYRGAEIDVLYQPEASIKMGCYLLKYIVKQLGVDDPILVACAYHAGWGNVPAWIEQYSTDGATLKIDQIPKADTRNYARKVINSYAIYLQHYY